MKLLALFLSLMIVVQSFILPLPASAAAITYDSANNGSISGDIPCHKVGALLLAEGIALINGDQISVQAKDKTSNAVHELLAGKIIKNASNVSGPKPSISGTAYFNSGSALPSLEPNCSQESVDRKDGSTIVGHIVDITQNACTITPSSGATQQIPMESIAQIHSPNVFNFSIGMQPNTVPGKNNVASGEARAIVFTPTCHPVVATVTKHHMSRKKKIIIGIIVVAVIATAIACSVAIPIALSHGGGSRGPTQQQLLTLVNVGRQTPTPVVMPTPTGGYTIHVPPPTPPTTTPPYSPFGIR